MIAYIESFFIRWRRRFSRTEWAVRLLRLPRRSESGGAFGLVLLQIDGLGHRQFNRALENGRLPFMRSLALRESYALHSFYSGIPSNTPAVQAEMFYGVRTAVPAFHYVDRATGRVMKMYDNASACLVESRLGAHDPGLLTGGSSYGNIFSGGAGAEEAHFCADINGWKGLLHASNPFILPFLIVLYMDIFARTAFLIIVEFFLAFYDCVRGLIGGHGFKQEFGYIFTRVATCVLLRELIVAGVQIDIARGLPVIHANFVGYDEQAHRRGPSSRFAHWSLRGIDDALHRIWRAADRFEHKDYDVWIYSDHGQEKTTSYPLVYGRTLEEAVKKVFSETGEAVVTAMGSVGHLYIRNKSGDKHLANYASRLVKEADIPLVLAREGHHDVRAWTRDGDFLLSEKPEKVFGARHPFLVEGASDLRDLCFHKDAGDLVLMGWVEGEAPLTFPIENGAHAGIGPEETSGFALLPRDTPLDASGKPYLRPIDIRHAVQKFFGKDLFRHYASARPVAIRPVLDVMTYNVHGCVGMDGRLSVERIARVIARHDPDIIALQELDVGRRRSQGVDQVEQIARKLEMNFHFHPTYRLKDGHYGNAILSRYPMSVVKMGELPGFYKRGRENPGWEVRGALWVAVDVEGARFQLINTHLSIWPIERLTQARALAGPEWLSHPDCRGPVVLCGDLNAQPHTPAYKHLCKNLKDSQRSLADHRPKRTWSGRYGISRIDHVFLGPEWEVLRVEVPRSNMDRVASDHLPLLVRLKTPAVKNHGIML